MKIIDDRSRGKNIWFGTMAVGNTFFAAGDVCIKISLDSWFNFHTNRIVYVIDKRVPYELVNAELVLKDFKGEENGD